MGSLRTSTINRHSGAAGELNEAFALLNGQMSERRRLQVDNQLPTLSHHHGAASTLGGGGTIVGSGSQKKPICMIGTFCNEPEVGLSATLVKVVVQALRCEARGAIPYVYWEASTRKDYCMQGNGSGNCWTNFFQPTVDPSELRGRNAVCHNEDNSFMVHGYNPVVIRDNAPLRGATESIFDRYLQLVPSLHGKVDTFIQRHFEGHKVVGVHVRGGDGATEYGETAIPVDMYINESARVAERLGTSVRFYVASNCRGAVRAFRERFGNDAVLELEGVPRPDDSGSSSGWSAPENRQSPETAAMVQSNAESIIMDAWLLSLCDHFVFWETSQSWAVLLKRHDLPASRVGQPMEELDPDVLAETWRKFSNPEDFAPNNFEEVSRHKIKNHLDQMRQTVVEMNVEIDRYLASPVNVPMPCKDCESLFATLGLEPQEDLPRRDGDFH
jgi:hypothetical protein